MLFEQAPRFRGFSADSFKVFAIPDRVQRRQAILDEFHPVLADLGSDLLQRLTPAAQVPLHAHLPRLDWPRGYEPFCTWLALSRETHGYQAGPQLNLGVHAGHVSARLGWDTQADAFGRFEFLCLHGRVGAGLVGLAADEGLRFRVYGAAPWPEGSNCLFDSDADIAASFHEVQRAGVWWEVGRLYELPGETATICSPDFGKQVTSIFLALLPAYDRIAGHGQP